MNHPDNNQRIDFVITWVDGSDPDWLRERDQHADTRRRAGMAASRFRDWENLRYWFRGVERFAPWVGNIFFVTWGHVPSWLDTSHPKLRIVRHEDFIPQQYLPTFNSNVIEFHFHRIEGLSERFVYFNDDVFLLREAKPERFFRGGLPCDIGAMTVNMHSGMFGANVLLAKTLINEHFNKRTSVGRNKGKWFNTAYPLQSLLNVPCYLVRRDEFLGFVNPHLAQGYLKSTYHDVWAECEADLRRTAGNRFRDYSDITSWLLRYWQLASGRFAPCNTKRDGRYILLDDGNIDETASIIRGQKAGIACLNDSDALSHFEPAKQRLIEAFEAILPGKGSFERD